jgi:hypothetical protein
MTITKIAERKVVQTIIDTVEVEESHVKDYYMIKDSDKCWLWQVKATFKDIDLNINKTLFKYKSRSTEVFWKERSHKFLFFCYGKFVNYQEIKSTYVRLLKER